MIDDGVLNYSIIDNHGDNLTSTKPAVTIFTLQTMPLAQEIQDRILLYSAVTIAICLQNEYVKRRLLPTKLRKDLWKSTDLHALQWLHEYKVPGCPIHAMDVAAGNWHLSPHRRIFTTWRWMVQQ
jgi:hypothetical protein